MKGMSNAQKDRLRSYLDKFKKNNGGCILCQKKIDEQGYYYVPSEFQGTLELHVYGSCAAHTMLIESEEKMAMEVVRKRPEYKPEHPKPVLMTVVYGKDAEDVLYA